MLRWIFALLLIPFLDAVLLAVIVTQFEALSWVGMILLVVLTGLVGMLLVRAEGRRTIRKMQRSLAQGKPPTNELLDGGLLIAAGAFLLTPGLVTDLLGFLLAVPLTRVPIRMALKRYVVVPYADKKTGGFASGGVWTFGFPNEDPTREAADSSDGGTYDLGEDAYSVDDEDAYTIDFEDERPDDGDDEDDPLAR
ncbi:phage T7 F exclusion suppressor FxsA [Natrinema pellirubrum DSM 15624]|uniref:Phage T7 F exclusion suppressor FxsA n=1 Tax=Natrinema pellirubrum (strain DSM 15624 / CIP 106293 / JCM 10476 / NCIMB 786 / 157) TaxID=797303 RepID=L0JSG4_NATP1|nr:FxsA family protein [Natrinema pellirubrum]AGB33286.1 protein affecting phage T7 exclusion by the F plasmid [Natrinema pellirubrum DSM 15624]ELY71653.1 phage T7 F exclusion suppressor FxsA [Natrinema pellirubrum DSM 15624]